MICARLLAGRTLIRVLADQGSGPGFELQVGHVGSQFDLPGSEQEWFALGLLEAYLQEFRPQPTDRIEPRQSGQADKPTDDLHASA